MNIIKDDGWKLCEKCKGWRLSIQGECRCRLFTVTDEYGNEGKAYGVDFEEVIGEYTERQDTEMQQSLVENDGTDFIVKDKISGETKKFRMYAEQTITYRIEEIK